MPDATDAPEISSEPASDDATGSGSITRKRPKPGERKVQILQALASMLEQPGGERITTSALAARLGVSEAALYRHFASKAQMFEGLIEFIEHSVFTLINQISGREVAPDALTGPDGARQAAKILAMLMQFAEKNPGMARVMVGDALVFENERLQQRMNLFFDKTEAALKQALRGTPGLDAQVVAAVAIAFAMGRLQRFVRSGFKRLPTEQLDASLARILG
ncbi:MAG: nucleoid occlusion factor SlmA [Burkholderiales bacterium PBB3]|nr:MAG: nucleoid occlusion factor SlmA [Burkholderiales bacterium PBB3]